MNRKLLAGLAAAGLLASGGSVSASAAARASTVAVISKAPDCGPLGPLVAQGKITRAEAVAIHDAFARYVRAHWRSTLDTVLGQEVKNHTISQAQASAVTKAIIGWVQKARSEEAGHHGPCH